MLNVSLPQKNNVASLTIDPRRVPRPSEARKLAQTRMKALRTQREAILQGFSLGGRRRELRDLSDLETVEDVCHSKSRMDPLVVVPET